MDTRFARSWLFVPGSRPDRFDKASASGADVVILDLEDAVPEREKDKARAMVSEWLDCGHDAFVRVNARDSDWLSNDLLALADHVGKGLLGVMIPKAESVDDVKEVAEGLHGPTQFVPLVETARGVLAAETIARQAGVVRLALGGLDLKLDLGLMGRDADLTHTQAHLALTSRAAGAAAPLDGVTPALRDEGAAARDVRSARRLGFGGKLCVHPEQVAPVNQGFLPDSDDVAWARRVVEAAETTSGEPLEMEGQLIDRPRIDHAKSLLTRLDSWGLNAPPASRI